MNNEWYLYYICVLILCVYVYDFTYEQGKIHRNTKNSDALWIVGIISLSTLHFLISNNVNWFCNDNNNNNSVCRPRWPWIMILLSSYLSLWVLEWHIMFAVRKEDMKTRKHLSLSQSNMHSRSRTCVVNYAVFPWDSQYLYHRDFF